MDKTRFDKEADGIKLNQMLLSNRNLIYLLTDYNSKKVNAEKIENISTFHETFFSKSYPKGCFLSRARHCCCSIDMSHSLFDCDHNIRQQAHKEESDTTWIPRAVFEVPHEDDILRTVQDVLTEQFKVHHTEKAKEGGITDPIIVLIKTDKGLHWARMTNKPQKVTDSVKKKGGTWKVPEWGNCEFSNKAGDEEIIVVPLTLLPGTAPDKIQPHTGNGIKLGVNAFYESEGHVGIHVPTKNVVLHVDTTSARVFKDSKQRCQDLYIRAKWYGLVHQFMRKLGAKEWYIVIQEEDIIKAENCAATITI